MNRNLTPHESHEHPLVEEDCISCGEGSQPDCPKSQRACGHHCDHSWSHDRCCWCGREWGVEDGGG